jgi:hypothetical protein
LSRELLQEIRNTSARKAPSRIKSLLNEDDKNASNNTTTSKTCLFLGIHRSLT